MEMRLIPGFPGYQATDDGRIWSERSKRFLKTPPDTNGYPQVNLWCHRQRTHIHVHQLILLTFVGPCPKGMECRHLKDVKTDNRLGSLAWGTRQENIADSKRNGNFWYNPGYVGSAHPRATVTEKEVAEIRSKYRPRRVTAPMLAIEYRTSASVIYNIVHRTHWKHVA